MDGCAFAVYIVFAGFLVRSVSCIRPSMSITRCGPVCIQAGYAVLGRIQGEIILLKSTFDAGPPEGLLLSSNQHDFIQ